VSFWEDDALREAPLYKLLDPSCFTLLLVGDRNTTALASTRDEVVYPWQPMLKVKHITAATSKEASFQFHDAFGSRQSFFLARPGSYLGFVGNQNALPALTQWLDRWFPPVAN
jgi:hypothetical protein